MYSLISAIIITKNEEKNIYKCLKSLTWVDEIIILDSGSNDKTLEIAKQFGNVKIYINKEWQGFGIQKNLALQYTKYDWILSIDADEIVSPNLADAVQKAINKDIKSIQDTMYNIHRINYFCRKKVKFSGWQNDKIIRVFNKKYAKFSEDKVHEKVLSLEKHSDKIKVLCLKGYLHHYTYTSFEQVLDKINNYSTLGAEQLHKINKKSSFMHAFLHGLSAFYKSYILKLGFLDGSIGFNIAKMNSLASYYKYIKLNLLNKNNKTLN